MSQVGHIVFRMLLRDPSGAIQEEVGKHINGETRIGNRNLGVICMKLVKTMDISRALVELEEKMS